MTMATISPTPPEEGMKSLNLEADPIKNINVIEFCVTLPNEVDGSDVPSALNTDKGVVGTVTFLNKSAMVWIGWGGLCDKETSDELNGAGIPAMGPLVVSMPRTKYSSFGSADETACSQLVGGQSEEEMMMGWQMAGRLSKKVGWPVFVSSSLVGSLMNNTGGSDVGDFDGNIMGASMVAIRAAAYAEKEVGRIILERKTASSDV